MRVVTTAASAYVQLTFSSTFIAALITIGRKWNQPRCPTTEELIKEDVLAIHSGLLFSCKEKQNHGTCEEVDGARNHGVEQSKAGSEI